MPLVVIGLYSVNCNIYHLDSDFAPVNVASKIPHFARGKIDGQYLMFTMHENYSFKQDLNLSNITYFIKILHTGKSSKNLYLYFIQNSKRI